jgi:hypothetical protein
MLSEILQLGKTRHSFFIVVFVKTLCTCSLLCKYVSLNKGYLLGSVKGKIHVFYGFAVFYAVWDFVNVSTEPFLYQQYQYFLRL